MNCSACGYEGIQPTATFCESCGATVVPTAPKSAAPSTNGKPGGACSCGATADKIGADGICAVCGEWNKPVSPRDSFAVLVDERRAARSDLGRKHFQNEDFVVVHGDENVTLVVLSDGVSSSEHPELASEHACKAALESLQEGLRASAAPDVNALILKSIDAAQAAVLKIPYHAGGRKEPPEATLVVAVVRGTEASIGWLGDSRAYVARPDGNGKATIEMLTEDHSWINEQLHAGTMTLEEALSDRRAHSITQSLGALPDGETLEPTVRAVTLHDDSVLVVCSDGFWNYSHLQQDQPPELMIELFGSTFASEEAASLAQRCVDYANAQGGRDNISVAVVKLGPK